MSKTILVVDDSPTMRQMNTVILKSAGFAVKAAADGKEALAAFNDEIDALVTDFNMPNMNGLELIEAIRNGGINQDVPIILVTTELEQDHSRSGNNTRIDNWLKKPFKKEELIDLVSKLF